MRVGRGEHQARLRSEIGAAQDLFFQLAGDEERVDGGDQRARPASLERERAHECFFAGPRGTAMARIARDDRPPSQGNAHLRSACAQRSLPVCFVRRPPMDDRRDLARRFADGDCAKRADWCKCTESRHSFVETADAKAAPTAIGKSRS